jgi:hypothetical protein
MLFVVAQAKSRKKRTRMADSVVINLAEIAAAENPAGFRETESLRCDGVP